jgi:hypothetical protein
VGLGLMSWALSSHDGDPVAAVGAMVKRGASQEALEAFREVSLLRTSLKSQFNFHYYRRLQ